MHLIGVLFMGVVLAFSISNTAARPTPYSNNEYSSEEELYDYADEPRDYSYEDEGVKFIPDLAKEIIEKQQREVVETLDKNKVHDILNNPELSPEERFTAIAQLAMEKFAELDDKKDVKTNHIINIEIEKNQDDNTEDMDIKPAKDIEATGKLTPNIEKKESESFVEKLPNGDKDEENKLITEAKSVDDKNLI